MQTLNIYIVPGLVIGCVYAVIASGLVLTYTTSGVLNLAYGSIAFAVASIYYEIHTLHHTFGTLVAAALCVFVVGPLLGMLLWHGLFKWLAGLGFVATLIATIGLAVAIPALCEMIFNPGTIFYAEGLSATGNDLTTVGPATFSVDQLVCVGAAVVVGVLLVVLLRFTLIGLKMRAVFDSASVASLMGESPGAISNISWAISGSLAAVGGIVLAPILGLTPPVFLTLTVASLAAALVGGMRSVAVTFVAAILIGVVGNALTGVDQNSSLLAQGVQPSLPFIVMAATVLLRRQRIATGQPQRRALEPPERFDRLRAILAKVAPAALLIVAVPLVLNSYWTGVVAIGLIYAIIFVGYTVALGYGGLIPLCIPALVGIGGFFAGDLAGSDGITLLLAILIGGLVSAGVGGALAFIGGRLGVLEFALLTLAFGLFADSFLFNWSTFVPPLNGRNFGVASLFGLQFSSGNRQYYLFAVVLGLVLLAVGGWYRRRTGAFYVAAGRMNARLAVATGIEPRTGRVIAFAIASGVVGLGGGLLRLEQGTLQPGDLTTAGGLVWLAVVVMMGIRSLPAAVIGGLVFAVFPALLSQWLPVRWGPLATVAFGLGALSLAQDPRGLVSLHAGQLTDALDRLRIRRPQPEKAT